MKKLTRIFFIPSHSRAEHSETTKHSCAPRVFRKSAFQTITYKALEINYHSVARLHAETLLPRKRDSDGSVIGSTRPQIYVSALLCPQVSLSKPS